MSQQIEQIQALAPTAELRDVIEKLNEVIAMINHMWAPDEGAE